MTANFGKFHGSGGVNAIPQSSGISRRIDTLENILLEEGVNQDEIREMIKLLRNKKALGSQAGSQDTSVSK